MFDGLREVRSNRVKEERMPYPTSWVCYPERIPSANLVFGGHSYRADYKQINFKCLSSSDVLEYFGIQKGEIDILIFPSGSLIKSYGSIENCLDYWSQQRPWLWHRGESLA